MSPQAAAEPKAASASKPGFGARLADLGAPAQAAIPGLYAWSVTVAPVAWARSAPPVAVAAAVLGALLLLAAPALAIRAPGPARLVSIWGFVGTSMVVWLLAPGPIAPGRLDGLRAAAGMVGWGLFALASAAPALQRAPGGPVAEPMPQAARAELPRGDLAYVFGGVALATVLQAVGWHAMPVERALLLRMVALSAGVGLVSSATALAIARHARRFPASRRARLRRGLFWLVLLGLLLASAALVLLR